MIFNRKTATVVMLIALLALSGCPGLDENNIDSGLSVRLAEVHVEQRITAPRSATVNNAIGAQKNSTALAVKGGYDRNNIEHHDIIDNHSHLVSIYRAYLVMDQLELVSCASLARLPLFLFDTLIPSAEAHAGHGAEPVGGRSLDKPNVIDIVTQDEYYLALGDLAVAPGRYCAVRLSLARLSGEAYGKPEAAPASQDDPVSIPEIPDMSGKMFALRADYCATDDGFGNCLMRERIDIDDNGLTLPPELTIEFDQPLELDTSHRNGYIALGIAYGEWAQNVDAALLASDPIERQKLIDNIAASIHVYAKGLGDLPSNVVVQ
jgi:hypothetical protein